MLVTQPLASANHGKAAVIPAAASRKAVADPVFVAALGRQNLGIAYADAAAFKAMIAADNAVMKALVAKTNLRK